MWWLPSTCVRLLIQTRIGLDYQMHIYTLVRESYAYLAWFCRPGQESFFGLLLKAKKFVNSDIMPMCPSG